MNQTPALDNPGFAQRLFACCWANASWLVWVYWCALLVGTHWPRFDEDPPDPIGPLDPVIQLDKLMHFFGFGGLMALLVMSGLGARGRAWRRRCAVALLIASSYAVVDELTQQWVPGRELDWTDILANLLGIMSFYLLALLPHRKEKTKPPRWLYVIIAGLIPTVLCLVLIPDMMGHLRDLKHAVWGKGALGLAPHMDYIFHGVMATVVSVLVILAWPMASRRPRMAAAAALAVLLLSAPVIEIVQHYTGRSVEAADARAHILGVGVAMIWWAIALLRNPHLQHADPANPGSTDRGRDV